MLEQRPLARRENIQLVTLNTLTDQQSRPHCVNRRSNANMKKTRKKHTHTHTRKSVNAFRFGVHISALATAFLLLSFIYTSFKYTFRLHAAQCGWYCCCSISVPRVVLEPLIEPSACQFGGCKQIIRQIN